MIAKLPGITAPLNVIVPTDFSLCSRRALDCAFQWARRFPCDIHLLHVTDKSGAGGRAVTGEPAARLDALRREVEAELRRQVSSYTEMLRLRPTEHHVVAGDPADEILALVRRLGAGMVFMGTHGHRGL